MNKEYAKDNSATSFLDSDVENAIDNYSSAPTAEQITALMTADTGFTWAASGALSTTADCKKCRSTDTDSTFGTCNYCTSDSTYWIAQTPHTANGPTGGSVFCYNCDDGYFVTTTGKCSGKNCYMLI